LLGTQFSNYISKCFAVLMVEMLASQALPGLPIFVDTSFCLLNHQDCLAPIFQLVPVG
jgi:hypothetical protein